MFGLDDDSTMHLAYLLGFLALVLVGGGFRPIRVVSALVTLTIWGAMLVAFVAIYAHRDTILRIAGPVIEEFRPDRATIETGSGGDTLSVPRDLDGHYRLDASVNGVSIPFLVDTGATRTVLSHADAERAGIDTDALVYDRMVRTANGVAFNARAELDEFRLGPLKIVGAPVAVAKPGMLESSLLGMDVLDRASGWRVENGALSILFGRQS